MAQTRIGRLIAMVYQQLGLLESDHLVEVQRSDLVAGHIGQTATKTREKIEEAKGGVLFIDEARPLRGSSRDQASAARGAARLPACVRHDVCVSRRAWQAYTLVGKGDKDFGVEAIEEIMRVMNDGDPVCIFAGYKGEMTQFVEANPGLYRRITQKFNFADYTAPQLAEMTRKIVAEQHFAYDDDRGHLLALFEGKVDLGIDEDGNLIAGAAGRGGGEASTSAAPPHAAPAHGEWACNVCTYLNEYTAARCLMCGSPRPRQMAPRPKARAVDPPALRRISSSQREMYGRVMYELIHANNGGLAMKLVTRAKRHLDGRLNDREVFAMDEATQRRMLFTFEDGDFTAAMRDEACEWLEHGKNMENHKRQQAFKTLRKDKDETAPPPATAPAPPPPVAAAQPVRAVDVTDVETPARQVGEQMASVVRMIADRNSAISPEEIAAATQLSVEDVRAVLSR